MALGESGGIQTSGIAYYGSKGHRKAVKARKGPVAKSQSGPAGRVRPGKGSVPYYRKPKGKR